MKVRTRAVAPRRTVCEACGTPWLFWRKKNRLRADGHAKHVWCPACRDVTLHREAPPPG